MEFGDADDFNVIFDSSRQTLTITTAQDLPNYGGYFLYYLGWIQTVE